MSITQKKKDRLSEERKKKRDKKKEEKRLEKGHADSRERLIKLCKDLIVPQFIKLGWKPRFEQYYTYSNHFKTGGIIVFTKTYKKRKEQLGLQSHSFYDQGIQGGDMKGYGQGYHHCIEIIDKDGPKIIVDSYTQSDEGFIDELEEKLSHII